MRSTLAVALHQTPFTPAHTRAVFGEEPRQESASLGRVRRPLRLIRLVPPKTLTIERLGNGEL